MSLLIIGGTLSERWERGNWIGGPAGWLQELTSQSGVVCVSDTNNNNKID